MPKFALKTVLSVCALAAMCIAFYGCTPIDWPAVLPEKESTSPTTTNRVVRVNNTTITKTTIITDDNAPDAAKAAEAFPPASPADLQHACDEYYAAVNSLATGNSGPMADVWSHAADATYVDVSGSMKVGWPGIEAALNQEAANKSGEQTTVENMVVNLKGEVAYTACIELIKQPGENGVSTSMERQATNVFRSEGGKWKLIHHHSTALSSPKPVNTEPNQAPAPAQQAEPNTTPQTEPNNTPAAPQ